MYMLAWPGCLKYYKFEFSPEHTSPLEPRTRVAFRHLHQARRIQPSLFNRPRAMLQIWATQHCNNNYYNYNKQAHTFSPLTASSV